MMYDNVPCRRPKISRQDKEIVKRLQKSSSPLRERYLEDLNFHKFSGNTKKKYIDALLRVTAHFWKSPEKLTEDDLRSYFSYLENGCQYSGSTLGIAHAALKFFYDYTCPKEMPFLKIYRSEKLVKQPVVLSREEVRKILSMVKDIRYRSCLTLVYSCGLRCNEAVNVKVGDIDSSQGLLYIRNGKGNKPRTIPLSKRMLEILREMWKSHRHPELLFPAYHINTRLNPNHYGCKDKPFSGSTVGGHFRAALYCSGCRKAATVHSLRHAFATHLLEEGIPIFTVKEYLGHASLKATLIYTHFTSKIRRDGQGSIEELMSDLS
jgi:site-specific recombinase XerD